MCYKGTVRYAKTTASSISRALSEAGRKLCSLTRSLNAEHTCWVSNNIDTGIAFSSKDIRSLHSSQAFLKTKRHNHPRFPPPQPSKRKWSIKGEETKVTHQLLSRLFLPSVSAALVPWIRCDRTETHYEAPEKYRVWNGKPNREDSFRTDRLCQLFHVTGKRQDLLRITQIQKIALARKLSLVQAGCFSSELLGTGSRSFDDADRIWMKAELG